MLQGGNIDIKRSLCKTMSLFRALQTEIHHFPQGWGTHVGGH